MREMWLLCGTLNCFFTLHKVWPRTKSLGLFNSFGGSASSFLLFFRGPAQMIRSQLSPIFERETRQTVFYQIFFSKCFCKYQIFQQLLALKFIDYVITKKAFLKKLKVYTNIYRIFLKNASIIRILNPMNIL